MSLTPPDQVHLSDMIEWTRKVQRFVSATTEGEFQRRVYCTDVLHSQSGQERVTTRKVMNESAFGNSRSRR